MNRLRPGILARNTIVILLALIWAVPTYLVIVNAMTPVTSYTGSPVWWPSGFALFENLATGWEAGSFTAPFLNSLLYATLGAGIAVILAAIAAFGLVIMPTKHKRLWFWLIYAGTLLPLQVFALPLYQAGVATELYDTKMILIIVYVALCIPFGFFVTRNFMVTLPPEIGQAAKIDGAGWWRMFVSIYLPLVRPAMVAAFVFQFIFIWNELFFGISLTISIENQPVMAAVATMQTQGSALSQPAILATALIVSLPAVLVFLFFQRFFVAGLTTNL
ncbi:carbohydrate ABC transporter permease [Microbacterium sp. H1-D42]|uniref:carbohydrate ABC transporter permease n=1 Tax=Microbacterium sp. H1-D42 TaxID=2925844 RepID=UPI001F53A3A5|nr:carbohydrate ABC transporter permease [Microbacterium sp. H1-D42]UNK70498.1 carbohydrate ABC transporter permease [Microbacterium sp. H1-D42]